MGLFKKKPDLISDRARTLNEQIAALEAQIKKLDTELLVQQRPPRLRSTTRPGTSSTATPGRSGAELAGLERTPLPPGVAEPVATEPTPRYNDLGIRRYDLPAALARLRRFFAGPGTRNPKLVSYLAAGSIKGLRPLRYERRVERNRLILLCIFLLLLLWAITAMIV